ncbi:orotate phosphoribosyltransferase [Halodesulfovibrio spirochaetisodalis]|uniref:Orotate phosphoribosyltransferase n=1 Tax=Halodesulfovibrio spirochaetisodalis TaxID=1560234 RepID=A0A1B7XMS4_9BACT|nr:orotate phosphoribosyltransferase [Halodesulfovibrio spirochaetisodalis]OBQ56820.1 Orotate phosphoribosyltransferase [Halodesulfovibrio spirochaetisodalis]
MAELKKRLAELLYEKSYKEGDFTLASGKKSDYYFDCRQTALHPEGAWLIGNLFYELICGLENAAEVKGVGGMTLGADPLVSSTSVISFEKGGHLPALIVRKQPKGHGTGQGVEGLANFEEGDVVVMLEDVVTTGGSVITAIERIEASGLKVSCVCAVLDRDEGGREALAERGYNLVSIFDRKELVALATS